MLDLWPDSVRDTSPLELLQTTAIAWLRADARMTALVAGRIYTAIPPGAPLPLVLVGNATAIDFPRFRHAGVEATIRFRPSSQVRGDYEVLRIGDQIRMVLERPTNQALPPFRTMTWSFDSAAAVYADDLAGVLTYHWPILMRVRLTIA